MKKHSLSQDPKDGTASNGSFVPALRAVVEGAA